MTSEVGTAYPPPVVTNPFCGCDKNVLGVMLFIALAVGVIVGMCLIGFDHARKSKWPPTP